MSKTSITDKITKLNQDVEWFYSDDFALDQASKKYKAATALAEDILKDLDQLKNEIKLIDEKFQ